MRTRKPAALLLCLIFVVASLAGCGGAKDFRNTNWGDSLARVSKSEDTDYFYASDEVIAFNGKMYDVDSEILFSFVDGALSEAQNKFLVGEWILADIIPHYKETVARLTEEYGAPLDEDYNVLHTDSPQYEEHKNDTEIYQVYYKILEFKSEWKTETSYYSLTLNYKDEQINYILYACPIENAP